MIDHWFSLHLLLLLLLLLLHFVCVCVCLCLSLVSLIRLVESISLSRHHRVNERESLMDRWKLYSEAAERARERARSCTRTGSRPVIKTFLVIVCAFWFLSSSSCTLATYDVPTSAAALFSAASAAVHKPLKWHPSSSSSSSSILFRFCCNNSNRGDRVRGKKKAPAS